MFDLTICVHDRNGRVKEGNMIYHKVGRTKDIRTGAGVPIPVSLPLWRSPRPPTFPRGRHCYFAFQLDFSAMVKLFGKCTTPAGLMYHWVQQQLLSRCTHHQCTACHGGPDPIKTVFRTAKNCNATNKTGSITSLPSRLAAATRMSECLTVGTSNGTRARGGYPATPRRNETAWIVKTDQKAKQHLINKHNNGIVLTSNQTGF